MNVCGARQSFKNCNNRFTIDSGKISEETERTCMRAHISLFIVALLIILLVSVSAFAFHFSLYSFGFIECHLNNNAMTLNLLPCLLTVNTFNVLVICRSKSPCVCVCWAHGTRSKKKRLNRIENRFLLLWYWSARYDKYHSLCTFISNTMRHRYPTINQLNDLNRSLWITHSLTCMRF